MKRVWKYEKCNVNFVEGNTTRKKHTNNSTKNGEKIKKHYYTHAEFFMKIKANNIV